MKEGDLPAVAAFFQLLLVLGCLLENKQDGMEHQTIRPF
jgi:hypothetical protein